MPTASSAASDPHANTTVVTIVADTPTSAEDQPPSLPSPKRARLSSPLRHLQSHSKSFTNNHSTSAAASLTAAGLMSAASRTLSNSQNLNNHEVLAVKQLITGEWKYP